VQIIGILLALLYLSLFAWWMLKTKWFMQLGFSKSILASALLIKVAGNYLQQALYTYYYTDRSTSDIYRFFDDGVILKSVLFKSPIDFFQILFSWNVDNDHFKVLYFDKMNSWIKPFEAGFYNDNHFMIKINALFSMISFDQYEVNGLLFTLLGFIGSVFLIGFIIQDSEKRNLALLVLIIIPSNSLWLVGGLKETMLMAGLGGFVFGYHELFINLNNKRSSWLIFLISFLILVSVKVYFIMGLIPALTVHYISQKYHLSLFKGLAVWAAIVVSGLIILPIVGFDYVAYIVTKQHDFINHMNEAQAGSTIAMEKIESSFMGVLLFSPEALANTLIKPLIPKSMPEVLLLIENVILFVFILISISNQKKNKVNSSTWTWIIAFSFTLLLLIGTTTPVLGAIMRYRAPILIVLIIALSEFLPSKISELTK
jgi:hypothetical protein